MTKIELLNDLDKTGMLMPLMKLGFLTPTLFTWRDVYLKYDVYLQTGKAKIDAEFLTAQEFKMSERHVRRIVKEMIR
jgi:hypothetical protein